MTDKELAVLIRKANSEGSGALLKLGWSLAHGIDFCPGVEALSSPSGALYFSLTFAVVLDYQKQHTSLLP